MATAVKCVIEFLDVHVAEMMLEAIAKALTVDEGCAGEVEVEVAEDASTRQLARKAFERFQMPGRMTGADHGADRGADDDVGLYAGFDECLEDADVGPAACRAAPECQTDLCLGHILTCECSSRSIPVVYVLNVRVGIWCPTTQETALKPAYASYIGLQD